MVIFFILLIIINIIFNKYNLLYCCYESLYIWFYNIYPSVFILYNISSILYNNKLFNKFSNILKKIIYFDSQKSYSLLIINIFLGNPGTTNLINESYERNEISERDFNKLVNICNFINPLFILSFFKISLYISYFISSFITILIIGKIFNYNNLNCAYINDNSIYKFDCKKLKTSINNTINILLYIAYFITFFNIIKTSLLFITYKFQHLHSIFIIIFSFLELSSGLKTIIHYNNILSILLLSFQGVCILFQSFNIINKKNISLKRYIFIHILYSIIATLIFYIISILFHI